LTGCYKIDNFFLEKKYSKKIGKITVLQLPAKYYEKTRK